MADNRKWLYDALTGRGANLGTYEQYEAALSEKSKLDWLYGAAQKTGINVGTREQLYAALATKEQPAADPLEDYRKDAEAQKAAIDKFDADNAAFFREHEHRAKMLADYGGDLPVEQEAALHNAVNESLPVYESRKALRAQMQKDYDSSPYARLQRLDPDGTAYGDMRRAEHDIETYSKQLEAAGDDDEKKRVKGLLKAAREDYYRNPIVIGTNEENARSAEGANARVEEHMRELRESHKGDEARKPGFAEQFAKAMSGVAGDSMAPQIAENYAGENEDRALAAAAESLNEDTAKIYRSPSKWGEESGWSNFWRGAAETASDIGFWTMGLSGMQDAMSLNGVFDKIRAKLGTEDLTEEKIDAALTPLEKDLYEAFCRNAMAQAERAEDMSKGYQAGASAADSLMFMAQFALTGGATEGAVKAMGKWLGKRLGVQALGKVGGLAAKGAGKVAQSAAMTLIQPTTYQGVLERVNRMEQSSPDDPSSPMRFVDESGAVLKGLGDAWVENFSEMVGGPIDKVLSLPFKGAGKLARRMFGNTKFLDLAEAFYNSSAVEALKKGGWNNYAGEVGEELVGAAMRQTLGIDDQALSQFFDKDNMDIMLLSFLPTMGMGGVVNTARAGVAIRDYDKADTKYREVSERLALQPGAMGNLKDAKTVGDVSAALTESIRAMMESGEKVGAEDVMSAVNLAKAAVRRRFYEDAGRLQVNGRRERDFAGLGEKYGTFWSDGGDGGRTVTRVMRDGKPGFAMATDETGLMSVTFDDGTKAMLRDADLDISGGAPVKEVMPLDAFLDKVDESRRRKSEGERVQMENNANLLKAQERLQPQTVVNIGTLDSKVPGTVQQWTPDGVVVVTEDGMSREYPWEEAQRLPLYEEDSAPEVPQVKTDAQAEEEAVEALESADERKRHYNLWRTHEATFRDGEKDVSGILMMARTDDDTASVKMQVRLSDGTEQEIDESQIISVDGKTPGQVQEYGREYEDVWGREDEEAAPVRDGNAGEGDSGIGVPSSDAAVQSTGAARAQESAPEPDLPLKDDGSVDQKALWNSGPEAWAKWNDAARGDGGANSEAYLGAVLKQVEGEGKALAKAYAKETDFDKRDKLEGRMLANAERSQKIGALLKGYADARAAAEKGRKEQERKERITARLEKERAALEANTPQTIEALAASMFSREDMRGKLDRDDFKRELGWGDAELRKFWPWWAKKGKGKTLTSIAESMPEFDDRGLIPMDSGADQKDTQAARNAIISVFQQALSPKDVTSFTRRQNEEAMERLRQEERDYVDGYFMQNYGMTADEYMASERAKDELEGTEGQMPAEPLSEEKSTSLTDSSDGHLAEHLDDVPDLLPTQDNDGFSEDKYTQSSEEDNMSSVSKDDSKIAESQESIPADAPLSNELNEFGVPFIESSDGTTVFGVLSDDSGLPPAPIKLSLGENATDKNGANHGYGLRHIEAGHGDQIRAAGYGSIEKFVEDVARNYDTIREGGIVANNQTYLLEVSDEHNNTLFIQLSRDGSYWNINSAGIFKKKYSRRKPEVFTRPALETETGTDSGRVDSSRLNGATAPAGNSHQTSESKDTNIFEESNIDSGKPVTEQITEQRKVVNTEPTDAQKEAGNYRMGHVKIDGMDVTIENPKGSIRRGTDADGKKWESEMHSDYGYIRGTKAVDNDHIDIFLSDNPETGNVFVVDQVNPKTGEFDESKVMYGFASEQEAKEAYLSNYEEGWKGLGKITEVTKEEFKKWIDSSTRKTKPFSEYASVKATEAQQEKDAEGIADVAEKVVKQQTKVKAKSDMSTGNEFHDAGEKIGAARKDLATKREKKAGDGKPGVPAWRKKWHLTNTRDGNILMTGDKYEEGKPIYAFTEHKSGRHHYLRDKDGNELAFSSAEEAENYLPIAEVLNQGFRVSEDKEDGRFHIVRRAASDYIDFETKEEALTYMASKEGALSLLNHKRDNFDIPNKQNITRNGRDWRGGKHIQSTEEFRSKFGFRGVEFGNWENRDERQQFVDMAYDALSDLAETLGISPQALSLGGELSIAFGARGGSVKAGGGSAAAHYEPARIVINLTKEHGSGSLAHEWFHALDNYFGRQDEKQSADRDEAGETAKNTWNSYATNDSWSRGGMRKEMKEAFHELVRTITKQTVEKEVEQADAQKSVDDIKARMRSDAFHEVDKYGCGLGYYEQIERGVTKYVYNRKTKKREEVHYAPTPEQLKRIKELLEAIVEHKNPEIHREFNMARGGWYLAGEEADELGEMLASIFPKGSDISRIRQGKFGNNLVYYYGRLESAEKELQMAKNAEKKTVVVDTEFKKHSMVYDRSRASTYWSTNLEMGARAFETYIRDRMADAGKNNDYLTWDKGEIYKKMFGVSPYPEGVERERINAAFDRLFETMNEEQDHTLHNEGVEIPMDMGTARKLIESAFRLNRDFYEENTVEEWLANTSDDEIGVLLDNTSELYQTYLQRLEGFGEDFLSVDIVRAYRNGTLSNGKLTSASAAERMDLSKAVKVADRRFYAPKEIHNAKKVFAVAMQHMDAGNRSEVMKARAQILLYAHNKGAAETLGISESRLNSILRTWSHYSAAARNMSMRVNEGVERSNRWTGIENMSYLARYEVTAKDIDRLVKRVEGDSDGTQRNYIARTIMGLDTHIDWSDLSFKFATKQQVNADDTNGEENNVLGFYSNKDRLIEVSYNHENTVSHEMGHALDDMWARELGYTTHYLSRSSGVRENMPEQVKQFVQHFNDFVGNLVIESGDNRSAYTQDRAETFARFVDYFIRYTEKTATGREMSLSHYDDKFTSRQVAEFIRLLQEKSVLDSQGLTGNDPTGKKRNVPASTSDEVSREQETTPAERDEQYARVEGTGTEGAAGKKTDASSEASGLAFDTVSQMLSDAGIPVERMSDEAMRELAENANALELMTGGRTPKQRWANDYVNAVHLATGQDKKTIREELVKKLEEARREAKELYADVLSGNFNDVTLQRIDNYIDNATDRNRFYRPLSQRLPERALSALRERERANAVDALFSRISESAVPSSGSAVERARARRAAEEKKKELLRGWAIATGNWHTSVLDFTDNAEPIGSGKDSDVYLSKDGKSVIKVSHGKNEGKKFSPDIDAVALFNSVFPDTQYEIVGYGEIDGRFVKFLQQPIVNFAEKAYVSVADRVSFMKKLGFEPRNKEKTVFSNGEIVVSDLQKGNIVRSADGNIRVIDADVKLHTKDIGGTYTYPPVEADTKIVDRIEFLKSGDTVYGAAVGGKILLNAEKLNPNTPVHEYTHLWDRACRTSNPELWRRGVELMRQTSVWKEVENDPNYSGLDEDGIASEVHSRLSGDNGEAVLTRMSQEIINEGGSPIDMAAKFSVISRLKKWLSDFWHWVKDTMTPWSREEAEKVSLEDFVNMPLVDLAKGTRISVDETGGASYRIVTDANEIDRLDSEPKIKVYRAMQLVDGKLYPPMSGKVNGKWRDGIAVEDLGKVWEKADENPELADDRGMFTLNKGNGTSLKARYNPYIHTSTTPLNDQFSSAQSRPELVTVEVEIPESALTSGYRAEKAKDSVGKVEWKAGAVQGKLSGTRTVILSRWDKPVRIVPDSEVADKIVEMFDGRDITMPSNVVTPSLRAELERRGVPFVETDNQGRRVEGDGIRYRQGDFISGLESIDEVYDALGELMETRHPLQLQSALEDYYGGEIRSASWGAKNAMQNEGLLPFPGDKYSGAKGEYHHIMFEGEDGNTFVKDVPFDTVENVEARLPERTKVSTARFRDESLDDVNERFNEQLARYQNGTLKWADKEKDLAYLSSASRYVQQEIDRQELLSAANIVKDFENPTPSDADRRRREATESARYNASDYRRSVSSRRLAAEKTANGLGVKVSYVSHAEMPENGRHAAGYWEDGQIYVCLENNIDAEDAVKTVLHEAVGHNGLRRLVGSGNMTAFCHEMFRKLPKVEREAIARDAVRNGGNLSEAVEEHLARIAETLNPDKSYERNLWDIIRDGVRRMLAKIGIDIPLSQRDLRWLLWQSAQANRLRDPLVQARRQAMANRLGFSRMAREISGEAEDAMRFRKADEAFDADAASLYNHQVMTARERLKEVWVDQFASVETLVDAIEEKSGKKARGFEDVRLALNQQSSKGLAAMQKWEREHWNPIGESVKKIIADTGMRLEDIERYVMLKHGLERNEVFAKRDARKHYQAMHDSEVDKIRSGGWAKDVKDAAMARADAALELRLSQIEAGTDSEYLKNRETDYGGLTGMYSEFDEIAPFDPVMETEEQFLARQKRARHPKYDNVGEMERAATAEVADFETKAGESVDMLWKAVNAATKATLRHQYESNMLSRKQYEDVKGMFRYYVPLRGFKDAEASDIYDYYQSDQRNGFSAPLVHAKGRTTEAESPFGNIGAMASSAIAQDAKNDAKLAFYYFVSNRPDNGLVTISDVWYEKQYDADGNPVTDKAGRTVFKPAYPEFRKFEHEMEDKAKRGDAFKGERKLSLDYVVHIDPAQEKAHVVRVKVGGKEKMMLINGNPRASQAINGEFNMERSDGFKNFLRKWLRYISGMNTSYNPEFWISNFQRDVLFSLMSASVKEDPEYFRLFRKNLVEARKVVAMNRALQDGTLGDSATEKAYREFVDNGGVTGYTVLKKAEEWDLALKKLTGDELAAVNGVKTAFEAVQQFGESIEQMTRFAAFLTSREHGKGIRESVSDAKELTVNFNRKGSGQAVTWEETARLRTDSGRPLNDVQRALVMGASGLSAYGRQYIMFFNAAVQGVNALYRLYGKDAKRTMMWAAGYAAVGAMCAALHALLDDDDDYLDIPDYERRNNLLIGGKGVYFKWALPQEARVFYALGDVAVNRILGREPHKAGVKGFTTEIGSMIGDVLPMNFMEGARGFVPSIAIPVVESVMNEDYKGSKIYNDMRYLSDEERKRTPSYQKAYRDTGKMLIDVSRALNGLTGGDYADAGWINLNPAVIEHLVEGYTGGAGTTVEKMLKFTVGRAVGGEFSVRSTPFLSRLLTINDERYRNAHTTDLFNYYKAEAEHTRKRLRTYSRNGDDKRLDALYDSKDYEIMLIYRQYKGLMEYYADQLKLTDDKAERKRLMREQDEYRKQMIREISEIR